MSWLRFAGVSVLLAGLTGSTSAQAAPARSRPAARPASPGNANAPRPKPPADPIRTLTVSPRAITFDGGGSQTLLISGITASGAQRDLTRNAVYRSKNPKVARVEADGTVRVVGDGAAHVEVRAGGVATRVPVKVRNARLRRPLNFANDILPVLGQAGCSQSACHAKQGGKGGFQLSVLAYDPAADYAAVVRQGEGRRVDLQAPAESLLLRKATLAVAHAGGQRFKVGSPEYALLSRWIAEGAPEGQPQDAQLTRIEVEPKERVLAPNSRQQLQVTGLYSDGSRRDVTALAQYLSNEAGVAEVADGAAIQTTDAAGEAAVMARYMGQVAVARFTVPQKATVPRDAYARLPRFNYIDQLVYGKLARLNLLPSALCDDATFHRRVYVDLIGTLPTAAETRAFLAECDAEKAEGEGGKAEGEGRKAERGRAEGGSTPNLPALKARAKLVERLLERTEYADYWASRWSNLVLVNRDLLEPRGAFVFDRWLRDAFRANMPFDQFAREIVTASGESYREGPPNFYRALANPEDRGKAVSQLFLGIRLDCAQCHHHPFERWGQDDFYSMAAFFAQVKTKSTYPEGYLSSIYPGENGETKHPKTGEVMPPRPPGTPTPQIPAGEDRREHLVKWMTAPDNPFFARTLVNRTWALLMGRGIVDPVDDFRATNPASNEALLDALAKDFVAHGFDQKHLLRTIVTSAAYQRSSEATPNNERDTRNYARYYPRRMVAEVLLDAVGQVSGVLQTYRAFPEGTRAIQLWDSRLDVDFLDIFGRPGRQSVCECERPTDGSVTQALHMMNSDAMQQRLSKDTGFAAALEKSGKPDDEVVQELFLTAVNRHPRPDELQAARTAFAREKTTRRQAIEDLLWVLLNSTEFLLNH